MHQTWDRRLFEEEMDAYFGAPALDVSAWEQALHDESRRHPEWLPPERKVAGYRLMAGQCPVHVFRHCPFYFELNTGRPRTDLGTGGLGGWLKREPFGKELAASSAAWWKPCHASALSTGWLVLDDNHHTVGYEAVFEHGLRGLARQAAERLGRAESDPERAFLTAAQAGLDALMRVAERLAGEAGRLAAQESDPAVRGNLDRIAATAGRVPAEPPATFYEALNTILFLFYAMQGLEGNGISVFGHVDRLLIPFYRRDLAAGRLTGDEARSLIGCFLAVSDARFGMRRAGGRHVGTNGTVTLGGCDADGNPLFNEVTRLILEEHRALRLVDPKVNARLSGRHPPEYLECLAAYQAAGGNSLAIFNDDVIIPANVREGKAPEDSRLYVGGGCQENVLATCEVNSRATIYLSAPAVFLMGFFPGRWRAFLDRAGLAPALYGACADFDALFRAFLANLRAVIQAHVDERNRTEAEGVRYNPCPLHSATLADCLERSRDMMAGGCRYNPGSISLAGIATLADSLLAVRQAVFDRPAITLAGLARMLDTNFDGEEVFRQHLLHRVPKFGQDDATAGAFAARVFADVAAASSGMPNTRGGRYEASLFSFRTFADFGRGLGATPDGRKAGEPLSAGMSPSLLALGSKAGLGPVLDALKPLDLTRYPVVAVLDLKLPAARNLKPVHLAPVIARFLASGGSVLQLNCVDQAMLREAKAHPERHPDLVVRISGYSAYFSALAPDLQDEVIARTELALPG